MGVGCALLAHRLNYKQDALQKTKHDAGTCPAGTTSANSRGCPPHLVGPYAARLCDEILDPVGQGLDMCFIMHAVAFATVLMCPRDANGRLQFPGEICPGSTVHVGKFVGAMLNAGTSRIW